jgi:hypothetical protein
MTDLELFTAPVPTKPRPTTTRPRYTPPVSTRLRAETCPRCLALTYRALDRDTAGLDTRLDPAPVPDPTHELGLRLTHRRTYDLIGTGQRPEIAYRDPARIRTDHRHPILATHTCHAPVPGLPLTLDTEPDRPPPTDPPF